MEQGAWGRGHGAGRAIVVKPFQGFNMAFPKYRLLITDYLLQTLCLLSPITGY